MPRLTLHPIALSAILGGALLAALPVQAAGTPIPSFQVLDRADVSPTVTKPAPRVRWLDASGSTGQTDPIATYTWRFGDGTDSVTTSRPRVRHAFSGFGTFSVELTVTDSDGESQSTTKEVQILPPVQLGQPIGENRAEVTEVIGWAPAVRPPATSDQLRELLPRARQGKPGANLTNCGARRGVLAFAFRFSGLPSDETTPRVVVVWSRDGRRLTRSQIDVSSNQGRGLFGTFVSAPNGDLANGLYVVTVTYRGKLLIRSYVNRSC